MVTQIKILKNLNNYKSTDTMVANLEDFSSTSANWGCEKSGSCGPSKID
jgi:hypothetical protein